METMESALWKQLRQKLHTLEEYRLDNFGRSPLDQERYLWQQLLSDLNQTGLHAPFSHFSVRYRSGRERLQLYDSGRVVIEEGHADLFCQKATAYLTQHLRKFLDLTPYEQTRYVLRCYSIRSQLTGRSHSYLAGCNFWALSDKLDFTAINRLLLESNVIYLAWYLPFLPFLPLGIKDTIPAPAARDSACYCALAPAFRFASPTLLLHRLANRGHIGTTVQPVAYTNWQASILQASLEPQPDGRRCCSLLLMRKVSFMPSVPQQLTGKAICWIPNRQKP